MPYNALLATRTGQRTRKPSTRYQQPATLLETDPPVLNRPGKPDTRTQPTRKPATSNPDAYPPTAYRYPPCNRPGRVDPIPATRQPEPPATDPDATACYKPVTSNPTQPTRKINMILQPVNPVPATASTEPTRTAATRTQTQDSPPPRTNRGYPANRFGTSIRLSGLVLRIKAFGT
jgi:hypothetical protein